MVGVFTISLALPPLQAKHCTYLNYWSHKERSVQRKRVTLWQMHTLGKIQ